MGAVYQAWDSELGVAVAVKVIRLDHRRGSASSEVEKRFKNELLLARQVTHKNVVRIHDLGEIKGIKYITMPYVQGDDLSTVLKREQKLPVARAMRFARQISSGLEAANDAGVVHRDLKPANVLLAVGGAPKITDFGLAKRRRGSDGDSRRRAAQTFHQIGGEVLNDHGGRRRRHRRIHGAGAGEGAAGRSTRRHLCVRPDPVRPAGRAAPRRARTERDRRASRADGTAAAAAEIGPAGGPGGVGRMVARCLEPDREKDTRPARNWRRISRLDEQRADPDTAPFYAADDRGGRVLVGGLVTGTWWLTRTPPVPKQHDR